MNEKDLEANPERALFDRAVAGLDPAASNRLRMARRAALAADAPRRRAYLPGLVAASGAVALVLGLAWWRPAAEVGAPSAGGAVATDDALLAAEEGEEEIYAWLGEAPVAADAEPEQSL